MAKRALQNTRINTIYSIRTLREEPVKRFSILASIILVLVLAAAASSAQADGPGSQTTCAWPHDGGPPAIESAKHDIGTNGWKMTVTNWCEPGYVFMEEIQRSDSSSGPWVDLGSPSHNFWISQCSDWQGFGCENTHTLAGVTGCAQSKSYRVKMWFADNSDTYVMDPLYEYC